MQAQDPDCEEVHREELHVVQRKLGACVPLRAFSCRIAQASSCAWCVKFLHVGTQLESLLHSPRRRCQQPQDIRVALGQASD